jgi:hypoxanthine phosphoribosyltransferase
LPAGFSEAFAKYERATEKGFMTMAEATDLSRDLAIKVRRADVASDLVVGIANGASMPARIVSDELEQPLEIVFVRRQGSRIKRRLLVVKDFLRIPPQLILWGPFLPLWRFFQNRTSKLEGGEGSLGFDVTGKRVLLVDDCVVTGNSLRHVRDRLLGAGASAVTTAVICWCKYDTTSVMEPEFHLHTQIQVYPWSNNSPWYRDFLEWLKVRGIPLWQ